MHDSAVLVPSGRNPSSNSVRDSLELKSNQSAVKVTDSLDDIRTVVADDFMQPDKDDDSLTYGYDEMKNFEQKFVTSHPSNEDDPYSHLRYNPDWREGNTSPELVIDFRDAPSLPKTPVNPTTESKSPQKSKSGAIIVHNPDLSPINDLDNTENRRIDDVTMTDRESMLRLSSDPVRMMEVNAQYESEFIKMMEMEEKNAESGQHQSENYFSSPNDSYNNPNFQFKSRIPKPKSYSKPMSRRSDNHHSPNNTRPQDYHYLDPEQTPYFTPSPRGNIEDKHNYGDTYSPKQNSDKKGINFPAPPEAPKSNRDRDYIELNKMRLGRKSNSASYLEMYSKRNKKEKNSPSTQERRPKSDSNKNKETPNKDQYTGNENELNNSSTVEDRWTQQADRLKYLASNGKPPIPRKAKQSRETLREVGNQSRPHNGDQNVYGTENQQSLTSSVSPRRQHHHHQSQSGSSESRTVSKHRYSYESEGSDFSDHPAFATFSDSTEPHFMPDGYHGDAIDGARRSEDKLARRETQQHFVSSEIRNADNGAMKGESPFYHVQNGGLANQQSPLMQAYNQRFAPRQPMRQQQQSYHQQQQNYSRPQQQNLSQNNFQQQYDQQESSYDDPIYQQYYYNQQSHHQHSQQQQHFNQQQQHFNQQQEVMSLPPSQGPIRSPRKIEMNHQDNNNMRGRINSDSSANNNNNSSQYDRKHVNFAPNVYPDQVYNKQLYKYPLPLPPTPPTVGKSGRLTPRGNYYVDTTKHVASDGLTPRGGYLSEGDQLAAGFIRNPNIPVLPPINPKSQNLNSSHDSSMLGGSPGSGGGGYLQQYEKQKQKKNYKKYTLSDYKNLKRDINLGGLGPDLISAKQKMGKVERSRKYAEFIRQQHKSNKKTHYSESDGDVSLDNNDKRFSMGAEAESKLLEIKERRHKQLEYSKQIPKPRLQPTFTSGGSPSLNPPSTHTTPRPNDLSPSGEHPQDDNFDWELLQAMRDRHEREKALVAGLSSSRLS